MISNYERVMKKFMPAFRSNVAKVMINEYGVKQERAAAILGTTQAAVSKYLKDSPDKYDDVKLDSGMVKSFIENMLKNNTKAGQRSMCGMCQLNQKFDCAFMVR